MGVRGETPQAGGTGGGRNHAFSGSSKGCVVVPVGSGWLRPIGEPLLPRRVNSHKLVVTCVFHVGRGRAGRRGAGGTGTLPTFSCVVGKSLSGWLEKPLH